MLCRVQHYLRNTQSLIKSSISSSVVSSNAPSEVFAPSSVFKAGLSSIPQRPKFPKQFRGKMKSSVSSQGSHISFGKFALQTLESAWITSRQIEAGRRAISRNVPRGGKLWVRVFPDKPISAKPSEVRMGRGKGPTKCWVAVVRPGRILYEVDGIPENIARMAIQIAGSKMPIKTRFIQSESHNRV